MITTPKPKPARIRWMIRRDMPAVLAIENAVFEFAWTEDDFIRCLRQRNCIGMVAEIDEEVVGFMMYELHKSRIHLISIAVAQSHQGRGIGKAMVAKLIGKLSSTGRNRITVEVRETNLAALNAFRSIGFRAVQVLKNLYEDSDEDAYLMQYRYIASEASNPANRIARLRG